MRVEVPSFERHDRPAQREHLEGGELTRPVHERGRGQVDGDRTGGVDLVDQPAGLGRPVGHLQPEERVRGRSEHGEEVLVPPHDRLGHTGRATRVEKEEIVTRAFDPLHRLVLLDEVLVAERAVEVGRPVVDLHHGAQLRRPVAHGADPLGELAVVHDRLGVRVVEEVGELVGGVAVVHVGRDGPQLEAGEQRLEVLVRVVEVERDLRAGAEAGVAEGRREPRRPLVELLPRATPVALHEGRVVRDRIGHGLEHRPEVPVHGPSFGVAGPQRTPRQRRLCRPLPHRRSLRRRQ